MNDELNQLIEDAAKLIGYSPFVIHDNCVYSSLSGKLMFNPRDPERGDLWKVAYAAKLEINFDLCELAAWHRDEKWGKTVGIAYQEWPEDDEEALKLAVLRAASAVWKARGGE